MDIKKLKVERFEQAMKLGGPLSKEGSNLLSWCTTTRDDGFSYIRIPHVKESDIVVGAKFWYDNSSMNFSDDIRLMTITHVRSGVAFYIDDKDDTERNFPTSGCLFSDRIIEYFEYDTDYNSELFKLESLYGRTIINYSN